MSVAGWSTSNGAIIEQWANACQDNEKFSVQFSSAGYTINPIYNSKLVSVNNYSVANGAAVVQWDNLGQSHQQYEIVDLGGGYYKIVSRYTNKCLAVTGSGMNNGDDVVQWEWLNNDNFKWAFEAPCLARAINGSPTLADADEQNGVFVSVSPNPASNLITINYTGINNAQIQIFDMSGKLMLSKKALNNSDKIYVGQDFQKGMYLLKLNGTNKSVVKKVVIQ